MNKIFVAIIAITLLGASCTGEAVKVGVVKTANGGVDWQSANKIKDTEKTLLEKSISKVSFNPAKDKIFASSFDGGLYSTEDAGENWSEVLSDVPIYDFVFNPNNDQIIYAASYLGERGRLLITKDGGKSWNEVYSDAGNKNPVRAVAVNPNNPSEVVIGLGKGALIKSTDEGATWQLSQNYNDRISKIVWESGSLYVVVKKTGIFRSTDNGSSYEQITRSLAKVSNRVQASIFGASSVNDYRQLAIDPYNSNNLFVTTNKGLYQSFDGGSSWKYVSMPVREQDANPYAVAMSQDGGSVIYVSSNSVIFKSTDGGSTWSASDAGTNGLVTSILISPNQNMLVFAGVSKP